jgi:hypothetical protein
MVAGEMVGGEMVAWGRWLRRGGDGCGGQVVAVGGGRKLMCGNFYVGYKSLSAPVVANPILFECDLKKIFNSFCKNVPVVKTGFKQWIRWNYEYKYLSICIPTLDEEDVECGSGLERQFYEINIY